VITIELQLTNNTMASKYKKNCHNVSLQPGLHRDHLLNQLDISQGVFPTNHLAMVLTNQTSNNIHKHKEHKQLALTKPN